MCIRDRYMGHGEIKLATFAAYTKRAGLFFIAFFLLSSIGLQAVRSLTDLWLQKEVAYRLSMSRIGWMGTIVQYTCCNVAAVIFREIWNVVYSMYASRKLYATMLAKVMTARMAFFDQNPLGRIINRFARDTFVVDHEVPIQVLSFVDIFAQTSAMITLSAFNMPEISYVMFFVGIMIYFLQGNYRRALRELSRLEASNLSKTLSWTDETTQGLITLRALKKETVFTREYLKRVREQAYASLSIDAMAPWLNMRLLFLSSVLFATVAMYCYSSIKERWVTHYAIFGLLINYSLQFTGHFSNVVAFFTLAETSFVSVERIRDYFSIPNEILNESSKDHAQEEEQTSTDAIRFVNVSINYTDPNYSHSIRALKSLSFSVKKGEKVAFYGKTGAGKSSIFNALFSIYDIAEGEIWIEGKHQKSMRNNLVSEIPVQSNRSAI
eukprot:TRINITY_DN1924_c0_g2_i2.p1 TRINITY_DN1924_c0_g2~~TRINITY_DN1924_c0_g2_i2.p1  ORF type:complete len:458 (+),score=57.98 TRINITY_DN1924_c0_g2_i2:62-1375(+)